MHGEYKWHAVALRELTYRGQTVAEWRGGVEVLTLVHLDTGDFLCERGWCFSETEWAGVAYVIANRSGLLHLAFIGELPEGVFEAFAPYVSEFGRVPERVEERTRDGLSQVRFYGKYLTYVQTPPDSCGLYRAAELFDLAHGYLIALTEPTPRGGLMTRGEIMGSPLALVQRPDLFEAARQRFQEVLKPVLELCQSAC